MGYDAELNLFYDDYDPKAEWEELQKIMDEQNDLDKEENERLYGTSEDLKFFKKITRAEE